MLNEILQWAALAVAMLVLLGLSRQVAQLLPPHLRMPSSGPEVGKPLPRKALEKVISTRANGAGRDGLLLAFVSESCVGCQRLLAQLPSQEPDSELLVITKAASAEFIQAIAEKGIRSINDKELWRACQVTATPLLVRVNSEGQVVAKEVTSDADAVVG